MNEIKETTQKMNYLMQGIDNALSRNFSSHKVKIKLKGKRAAGIDTIVSELMKNFDDPTPSIILKILNKTFASGEFPEDWAVGIIVILFKGCEKNNLNNYRGLPLLGVTVKFLVGMLNES